MAEPEVQFTVKELLAKMDERADERQRDVLQAVGSLNRRVDKIVTERIEPLERAHAKRSTERASMSKLWIGAVAVVGVIEAFPAFIFYLKGHP